RSAIFFIVKKYAPVLGNDARDEILNDFYLGLLENDRRKLRAFRSERGTLKNWLQIIARHTALDHVRKVVNRPRLVDIDEFLADEDHAPEEAASDELSCNLSAKRFDVVDARAWWLADQAAKKAVRRPRLKREKKTVFG